MLIERALGHAITLVRLSVHTLAKLREILLIVRRVLVHIVGVVWLVVVRMAVVREVLLALSTMTMLMHLLLVLSSRMLASRSSRIRRVVAAMLSCLSKSAWCLVHKVRFMSSKNVCKTIVRHVDRRHGLCILSAKDTMRQRRSYLGLRRREAVVSRTAAKSTSGTLLRCSRFLLRCIVLSIAAIVIVV